MLQYKENQIVFNADLILSKTGLRRVSGWVQNPGWGALTPVTWLGMVGGELRRLQDCVQNSTPYTLYSSHLSEKWVAVTTMG